MSEEPKKIQKVKLTEENVKKHNSANSDDSDSYDDDSDNNSVESESHSINSKTNSAFKPTNQSSSSTSLPNTPIKLKDASETYSKILGKNPKIVQSSTAQITLLDRGKISNHTINTKDLPKYYTFVIKDGKIINVFESKTEIILGSSNLYENEKDFSLPNNYITATDPNDFNSIFAINTANIPNEFTNKEMYESFTSYTDTVSNSSIIQFVIYKYDELSTPTTYFTYGDIFIYGCGIASTCEIKLKGKEDFSKTKTNVLKRLSKIAVPEITINYTATSNKTDYVKFIQTIKSKIFSSSEINSIVAKSVYIYFLNAILPEDFATIFNDIKKINAVINILYVNISYHEEETSIEKKIDIETFNKLHANINYYYAYKNNTDLESEYTKEKRMFDKQQKINKYIEFLQTKNDQTNYFSHFAMHIFDFFEFLMFLKDKDPNLELLNACITIYNYYCIAYDNGFKELALTNELLQKIQDNIKKKLKMPYTYLQIVNPEQKPHNTKFEIRLNKNEKNKTTQYDDTSMILTYTASPLKFYNQDGLEIEDNIKNTKKYTNEYKFGPFNKIYRANAKDIVVSNDNDFKIVIDKIISGSPMMFSFHAPSGSGKTEVLKTLLISLCNALGKKKYKKLNIKFTEFFKKHDDSSNDIETVITQTFTLDFYESLFNGGDSFKINYEFKHTPYHKTRIGILNREKTPNQKQPEEKIFNKNDKLETLLTYFLEEDRLIKGFPTNYNSSRSHVVCFLEMEKEDGSDKRHIIFDDLAGNEKEYNCDLNLDINRFINIKKKDGKSFYENEFDSSGEKFDSYNGGSQQSEMQEEMKNQGTAGELYKKIIKQACNNRLPEGKFINESLKDFRKDLEYLIDVKNRNNAYYVPDIYSNANVSDSFNFIDYSCVQDFCYGKTSCFSLKKIKEITEPTSVIMKSVYNYLLEKNVISDPKTFYDTLEVCIFGILNISRKKNDPPVIHYNDINSVKSILNGKDEFTFNCIPEMITNFKRNLKKASTNALMLTSEPETYVYDLLDKCKREIYSKKSEINNPVFMSLAEIETFKSVFDIIDDENAKTAIGTLEFMNRISKLNTINSICSQNQYGSVNYVPLYPTK